MANAARRWRSRLTLGRSRVLLWMIAGGLAAAAAEAGGPWRASDGNTRGWQLMTPAERLDHQARIRGFATLEECRAYQQEHHRQMEARARQRGLPLPGGRRDLCEHLQPAAAPGQ
jgi:hypothetical protein